MSNLEVKDLILLKENTKPGQLDNLRGLHLSKFDRERFLWPGQWGSWSNISNIPPIPDIPVNLYEFWHHTYTAHTTMTSTMKITNNSKRALLKIGAEYTVKDGKERTLEAVVKLLIEEHKRKGKLN